MSPLKSLFNFCLLKQGLMYPRLVLDSLRSLGDLELLTVLLRIAGVCHRAQTMLC